MLNDVLTLSLFVILGHISGRLLERIRLPALIGYILVGFLMGPAIFGFVDRAVIDELDFVGVIALGVIAFVIGGRIEIAEIKKLKENLLFIAIFQAMATFALVTLIVWPLSGSLPLALLLGAIGTATAPAAVFGVIEEYRARGPLTNTLLSIVAIDDAICIMLFGIVIAIVEVLMGSSGAVLEADIGMATLNVFGSIAIGTITGFVIAFIISRTHDIHRIAYIVAGFIFLGCGIAIALHFSALLTNMACGFVVINISRKGKELIELIEKSEEPILIVFFALAGAHLKLESISEIWPLFITYIFVRAAGKMLGGSVGARLGHAPKTVRNYLGLGLLPQAGVAIGLLYVVQEKIPALSATVVAVVLTSVIVNEFLGPIGVEIALIKSKETENSRGSNLL